MANERVLARTRRLSWDTSRCFLSRRGYHTRATDVGHLDHPVVASGSAQAGPYIYDEDLFDPDLPTQFGGVFRAARNADEVPTLRVADLTRTGVQAGILRSDVDSVPGVDRENPFFVRPDVTPMPVHRHRIANPLMHYQTLTRMPNLVTDQSQVFVVRMTMGFFEVDAATLNLGREYNAELGQNKRYRATFIIDRSIPVAFEIGEDRNVRDTILFAEDRRVRKMNTQMTHHRRVGFTLVEMLVAMAVTLLLMAALSKAFALIGRERACESSGGRSGVASA